MHRIIKQNDMNHDKWIGIGGKFEEGETPEECAFREVTEETGLIPDELIYRGIVTFVSNEYGTIFMHLFDIKKFHGQLIDCDEGVLEWVPKKDLIKLPIWKGDFIFFDLLDANEPFFSLKLVYEGEQLTAAKLNGKPLNLDEVLPCIQ